jgi:hypothetical protein
MLQEFKTPPRCRPVTQRGVAQPGRAPALGAGSRQFESGRPDLARYQQMTLGLFVSRGRTAQIRTVSILFLAAESF